MSRTLIVFTLLVMAIAVPVFLIGDRVEQDNPNDKDKSRFITEPVLKAYELTFFEKEQTTFKFNLLPDDSVRFFCPKCIEMIDKGELTMFLQGSDIDVMVLGRKLHNRWLSPGSERGSFGIVFTRDKSKNRVLRIPRLEVWRKNVPPPYSPKPVQTLIGVEGLHVENVVGDPEIPAPTFMFAMRNEDRIRIAMNSNTKELVGNLVYNWYRQGESIAKERGNNNVELIIPRYVEYGDSMQFEFGQLEQIKKVSPIYNLEMELWRKPPYRPTSDLDSLGGDSTGPKIKTREELLFEALLKRFGDVPQKFACSTPPLTDQKLIPGKLNIMAGQSNMQCIQIQLSDACYNDTAVCPSCESFYVFWIGVGDKAINSYELKNNERKALGGDGLLEAYAKSIYFRGGKGVGTFPRVESGEDVQFVILNSEFVREFSTKTDSLNDFLQTISDLKYIADTSGVELPEIPNMIWSNGTASSTYYAKLNWTSSVDQMISICFWNDNAISPIPVYFTYQQFIYQPDTVKVPL
ncbi:MAG: hypothetical protein H6581_16095 [Bacteroidia bacterium]|nr:hypothetical protein [Bacteroidia bacterium]